MSRNAQNKARRPFWFWCWLILSLQLLPQARGQALRGADATNASDARVVIVSDPGATEDLQPVPDKVQSLVDRAITNLTRQATVRAAWRSLVSAKDVIGIKVYSEPGPSSGTRKDVVAAVVQDLLNAGLPPTNIIVWDRRTPDLRRAGYFELQKKFGIRVQSSTESGYDEKKFYESPLLGTLAFDDFDFGKKGPGVGRKSYVSNLVAHEANKIITITPLLHHNILGLTGNLYSLAMGSVDNTARFSNSVEDLARAIPEICALPINGEDDYLSDHVVLSIVDALMCQYEGQQRSLLHYSTVLNQLRFSKDAVALDYLSLQEINAQRQLAGDTLTTTNMDLLLNAALLKIGINNPNHIQVEKIP